MIMCVLGDKVKKTTVGQKFAVAQCNPKVKGDTRVEKKNVLGLLSRANTQKTHNLIQQTNSHLLK